jgi:hypothetical protein
MSQSDSRMLIVLEAHDPETAEIRASLSRRLVAALREQTLVGDEDESLNRRFNRWIASFGHHNRSVTLALVILLVISSLVFGLGSALQIDQVERPGVSISERIGSLIGGREKGAATTGQDFGQTPKLANSIVLYGAGFSWPDRFSNVEVQRETASSKVLWPLSTIVSMLILVALLLPQSNRTPQKSSAD